MKAIFYTTILLSCTCLVNCSGGNMMSHDFITLDAEAAIDNRQPFDISNIADKIEFIVLDDGDQESLIGDIKLVEETESGFYISDDWESPVKIFDRTGKFLSTLGRIGRGPGEYEFLLDMAVDYQTDNVYMNVRAGSPSIFMYDSNNRFVRSISSPSYGVSTRISSLGDQIIVMHYPYVEPDDDGKITLIDIFSPELKSLGSLKIPHRTTNTFFIRGKQILSNNGKDLLVKEGLNDTLFHYRQGALVPVYSMSMGRYFFSPEMWDMSMRDQWNKYYQVTNVFDGDRYMIVETMRGFNGPKSHLIFDKRDCATGFSVVGPDGQSTLFIDGITLTTMYIRDNRLVGYMQAFDIVDNADAITDPYLKTLVAHLEEDSNPVIVIAELKK